MLTTKTADPFRSTVRERRISDVAFDCGFNDLSYFNRCFRRRFGLTPTAARGALISSDNLTQLAACIRVTI